MDIEIALNSKCNVCKCYWKPTDADIKPSGLVSKSCTKCKEYQKKIRQKINANIISQNQDVKNVAVVKFANTIK